MVTVSGRVVYRSVPVKQAFVFIYDSIDRMTKNLPLKSTTTDGNGNYSISLSGGKYYFTATKGYSIYSYSGRNPITVSGDKEMWVGFQAEGYLKSVVSEYDDEFSSAISGRVLLNNKPVEGAYVTLFMDGLDDFKGPGYSITSSDSNGEFFFEYLPESEYFVLARKRRSGERVGPIDDNDLYAYFPGNPLSTENGKMVEITLNSVSKIADERVNRAVLPDTGFAGRVLDTSGNPVAGMYVFAYTDSVIGHKRPEALSFKTDAGGRYVVELKKGGMYYIGARERHGDSPIPGELFGMYDKTDDHGIRVESGSFLEQIDIFVEKIMIK